MAHMPRVLTPLMRSSVPNGIFSRLYTGAIRSSISAEESIVVGKFRPNDSTQTCSNRNAIIKCSFKVPDVHQCVAA